jgi:hypothetical protein
MAHECWDCGQTCHCGGDIDDMLMNGTVEELRCTHCDGDGDFDADNDNGARDCDHPSIHVEAGGFIVCSDCGEDVTRASFAAAAKER